MGCGCEVSAVSEHVGLLNLAFKAPDPNLDSLCLEGALSLRLWDVILYSSTNSLIKLDDTLPIWCMAPPSPHPRITSILRSHHTTLG